MKKNKNLIIFMPFIGIGGVEKNLFVISNYLIKKVENLSVCTSSNKYKKKFDKKIKFISPKKKISENLNIRLKYILCLFLLFKLFLKNKNFTVISFQANIYCILLCKLFNVQVIVRSNSSPSGWYHNNFKKFVYKKIISLADEVIVNSDDFKKEMEKKFSIKVNCIFNPLNINEIKKKASTIYKNNFFKKKFLKIINVGRLTHQKDQITILKAINKLKNRIKIKLIIIGRGVEKKNLLKFIKQNSLTKIVQIRYPTNNVYGYLKSSDLFVLSSKYEGLPNVLLEAATLKKFIISSDCPTGPREILKNGSAGLLFKVGDVNDLEKKIFFFYKNKKKLNNRTNVLYQSLSKYDYKKNLERYWNVVKKHI